MALLDLCFHLWTSVCLSATESGGGPPHSKTSREIEHFIPLSSYAPHTSGQSHPNPTRRRCLAFEERERSHCGRSDTYLSSGSEMVLRARAIRSIRSSGWRSSRG